MDNLRPASRRLILEKVPFFIAGFGFGMVTFRLHKACRRFDTTGNFSHLRQA